MSTSADDHKYKRIASYPRFPVKFKSKRWTCKIARKVLKDILEVEGFGSGSQKCYGRARDEPDSWPYTTYFLGKFQRTFICKAGNLQ